MVEIDVRLDDGVLREMRKAQERYGERIIQRAKRDAARKTRTTLKREICKRYNIKQKEADEFIAVHDGEVCAESRKLTVGMDTHFSHTPQAYKSQENIAVKRRKRATATIIKGGKKKFKHAFVLNPAKVKNGSKVMLWKRKGKQAPEPIRSTSIAEMANQWQIKQEAERTMNRTFENRLNHYIEREASKIANH